MPNTQVWLVAQQGDDREHRQFLTDVNGQTVYTMTEDYPLVNDWMGQVAQTDLSAYSDGTYSFYVEMGVSNAGEYHGYYKSESFSYEDLVAAGHVVADIEPLKTPWNAAMGDVPWSHTPEPSGGLLTLVGAALLLLRRRRGCGVIAASLVLCKVHAKHVLPVFSRADGQGSSRPLLPLRAAAVRKGALLGGAVAG